MFSFASTCKLKDFLGLGRPSAGAQHKFSFRLVKALSCSSVHSRTSEGFDFPFKREYNGVTAFAKSGMKSLK